MRHTRILIAVLAVTSLALTPTPTPALSLEGLPPEIASLVKGLNGKRAESLTAQPEKLEWIGGWYEALKVAVPDLMPVTMDDFMRPDDRTMIVFEAASMPGVVVVPPLGDWADMKAPPKKPLTKRDVEGTPGMVFSREAGEALFKELQIPADAGLSQRDGGFAYVDAEGCVVGKVDAETGEWELAMRIDKGGKLHLNEHVLESLYFKEYGVGDNTYHFPVIDGVDVHYTSKLLDLGNNGHHVEVSYKALNGSKGLPDYWNDKMHISFDGLGEGIVSRIISSEETDPVDGISFTVGVKGTISRLFVIHGGKKICIYDKEDMKYITTSVAR